MRVALSLFLCLALTACGFHLRGTASLPPGFQQVYLDSASGTRELATTLKQTLRTAGVRVSDTVTDADHTLILIDEQLERREISVSRQVDTAEYELRLSVNWRLTRQDGTVVVPSETATARLVYRYDVDNVTGKQREENRLKSELRQSAARQILRRIEYADRAGAAE